MIPAKVINQGTDIYESINALFLGVERSFILAYSIAANSASN